MVMCTCTYTVFMSMCDCDMVFVFLFLSLSFFFLYYVFLFLSPSLPLSPSLSLPLSSSSSCRYSQLLSEDTPETLVRLQSVHEVHGLITSSPTPSTGNHNVLFVDTSNNMHTSSCPCVNMDYGL